MNLEQWKLSICRLPFSDVVALVAAIKEHRHAVLVEHRRSSRTKKKKENPS